MRRTCVRFIGRAAAAALFIAAPLTLSFAGEPPSGRADIPSRIDSLVDRLTVSYQKSDLRRLKAALAVFPLNSNPSLARRRVGAALSELLTHGLVSRPEFAVVERADLDKVLAEQKFQRSGQIDPESATKAGKMLGARLLLLGSVDKLGGRYQVNARLVDVQTDQVVAVAYEQLDADLFEEAARPYLNLVPETQTIGLYLLFNYRSNPNHLAPYQASTGGFGTPVTVAPKQFSTALVGGGLRYFPTARLMIDASVAVNTQSAAYTNGNEWDDKKQILSGQLLVMRATGNWVHPWSRRLRSIVGAGLASYKFTTDSHNTTKFDTAIVPAVRFGGEFRPQERVGLSLLVNYDFLRKEGVDTTVNQAAIKFAPLSFEPAVSVYF